MSSNATGGPLAGIKILDWTMWQFGPVGSSMLGDMGADVIKIESLDGDAGRGLEVDAQGRHEEWGGRNAYFETCNRNKRGIAVNLKTDEGKEIVYNLVKTADVFVENFRKGVAERLGVDYETLREINPKLVYASATGYGPEGPESFQPAFDSCGQARGGLMMAAAQAEATEPPLVGAGPADQMGGIMLCLGVLAGLVNRNHRGLGQKVDASHLGSIMWLVGLDISMGLLNGSFPAPQSRRNPGNPMYNHYQCKDGCWIILTMHQSDRYWAGFAEVLGISNLIDDPRFANLEVRNQHSAEMRQILDERFATKDYEEWDKAFQAAGDFIYTKVQNLDALETDSQVLANDYIVPFDHPVLGQVKMCNHTINYSETPAGIWREAPELGQHTEEVLLESGYDWDQIAKFKDVGAIL